MIAAKDLLAGKYNKFTRAQYKNSDDSYVREKELMYLCLLQEPHKYDTDNKQLAEEAKSAGYIVKETEFEKDDYEVKEVRSYVFFTKYERVKNGKTRKIYSAEIFLPEEDEQLENKSSYNLTIITNKGGNSVLRLDNVSKKEVSTYVEDAYKIGALATGTGYISTSIIDKIDIKEIT